MNATSTTLPIDVNGERQDVPAGTTVRALVRERLQLKDDRIAIELNRQILPSTQWDRALATGDRLEIVTLVGGG